GSTDNSYSYCLDYKNKHQNVILINKKNSGVSSARNIGLERARGKYIYFCDPDDILNSNLLEENYEIAEKYKANVVIFG
ncbi:glycosyltransferase family 2 protein, partial [Lactobacillus helveticus]